MTAEGDGPGKSLSGAVHFSNHLSGNSESADAPFFGRDSLDRKMRYTSLTEFIRRSGGNRLIQKILIANNGIAAVKCMRSLRKWSYATFHDSEALIFVCMATPEDMQANAEYIKMANKTVMVPGGSNINNYANVDLILQTAITTEVDAVWAGWGHASENPQLPEVLFKHNIAFLGPSQFAMWALGNKVVSTILAQSADVPTLGWSGSGLRIPLTPNNSHHTLFDADKQETDTSKTDCAAVPISEDQPNSHTQESASVRPQFYLNRKPGSQATNAFRSPWDTNSCRAAPMKLMTEDLYRQACVNDVASCQACADRIGYPVMIKAADGGGGKGIRKACNPEEVARFFPQVQTEVPGSLIFVMKCAQKARHLEVQILADQYGQAISLFGRDCTIQRRHQKIIEEAPIVVAPANVIDAMERAAIRLSNLAGYVSAGTVEYLYDPHTNEFYFLELNPRLQVEHPCTEVIAEVNLPACQLQIAMGIPLHQIKDIRELYRLPLHSNDPVCFDTLQHNRRPPSCYVIAARITSEDPDEGFKPRSGGVQELNFKSSQSVWGYFSVGSAGGLHEFADSQFGHCFSAAESRDKARENLVLALKELSIRGDFRTTVEYLIKIMESDAFMNHEVDTDWLDRRISQKDQVEKPNTLLGVVCTAAHIADRALRQLTQNYELHLERGQFLPSNSLTNSVDVNLVSGSTKYALKVFRTGSSSFHLIANGSMLCIDAHRMCSDGLLICHELASYMTYCHEDSQCYRTVINNRTTVFYKEVDPSVLRSHSTGKLLQFTVADKAHVTANEVYALVEVMKLVLELRVPAAGIITLKRTAGCTLEPGTELARLQLDDPTQLKTLKPYTGPLVLPLGTGTFGRAVSLQGDVTVPGSFMNSDHSTNTSTVVFRDGMSKMRASMSGLSLDNDQYADSHSSSSSLPRCGVGNLHRNFDRVMASLEQVLLGYALPEPFLTPWLRDNLEKLMSFLHDPRLPLLELQSTIAHLSGRLPAQLERDLRAQAKQYAGQVTSVMANFPSRQILRLIDAHAARICRDVTPKSAADEEMLKFRQTVQRLVDLADRYQNGLRGHTVRVLSQLLLGYYAIEKHFQHGQYDKCARQLLARCRSTAVWANDPSIMGFDFVPDDAVADDDGDYEDEQTEIGPPHRFHNIDSVSPALQHLIQPQTISDIVAVVFSHRQLSVKNALIVSLIDMLWERRELSTTCSLKDSLKALTELGAAGNAKVALSSRQLLISMQTPSYELRRNQVESIFLSAVDVCGHQFHPENLHKLITSETVVFDILTDFFYHSNPTVASAALEVYIRRAYTAYELTSIQRVQLPNGASFVPFRFTLPNAQCLTSDSHHFHRSFTNASVDASATNTEGPSSSVDLFGKPVPQSSQTIVWRNRVSSSPPNFLGLSIPQSGDGDGNCAAVSNAIPTPPSTNSPFPTEAETLSGSPGWIPVAGGSRNLPHVNYVPLTRERIGGMAAFNSLDDFEESFENVMQLFAEACTEERTVHNSLSEPSLFQFTRDQFSGIKTVAADDMYPDHSSRPPAVVTFQDPPYQTTHPEADPIHILNVALRHSDEWSDTCFSPETTFSNGLKRGSDTSLKSASRPCAEGAVSRTLSESDDVAQLEQFCSRHADQLRAAGIRRITFLIVKTREFPKCYTFRAKDHYLEDRVYRHLEPALAFQLELNRMRNYELEHVPTINRRMHLYLAKSKLPIGKNLVDHRFFVRCIIRHADLLSCEASFEFLQSEAERTLLEAMDALELAYTHPGASHVMGNHIFLNFAPILVLEDLNHLKSTIRRTVLRYARRFIRLRVTQAELKLRIRFHASDPIVPIRVALFDEQGYNLGLDVYREVLHPSTGELLLWSFGLPHGSLHGLPAELPHKTKDFLELKRFQARKFNTTYVYDYPQVIRQALLGLWHMYRPNSRCVSTDTPIASSDNNAGSSTRSQREVKDTSSASPSGQDLIVSCTELVLDAGGHLRPAIRPPGSNSIGMIVWHMVLRTPDSPSGRAIVVIANDATHMAGSFGPAEDLTFYRASQLARRLGIPRIYLASNTGARIRVAEEVKQVFRVAWLDALHPEKGYDYLYLTPDDFVLLRAQEAVNCQRIEVDHEVRYRILDIVGKDYDMSVENLRGSAMIAGETSAAYDDIFTITIVTNRAIGIGAYLARLGQRVIQVKNSHIILTGAMALNKLLGREVYSSNSQLGGVQVMANNGVSHLVAADELVALQQALDWLTYVPAQREHPLSVMHRPVPVGKIDDRSIPLPSNSRDCLPFDPIDRTVGYTPSRDRANEDPRWMFTGVMASKLISQNGSSPEGTLSSATGTTSAYKTADHWLSGFFDWGTWRETLVAWAAGAVVGRARLGGIPCGVITAESRSVTCRVPADPANLSTEVQVVNQAGQVWYPDSAYKTAQAIADMAREHLPLFIFASWRGFSGGMKDMYDQVLKFGSMIIDALRQYPEPVFVYLPPHSQLRGGAWVVVDPAINPDRMELYADPLTCRAGVLEPEGTVEIKYRKLDLIKTMRRLDDKCRQLVTELNGQLQASGHHFNKTAIGAGPIVPPNDRCLQLQVELEARQRELRPFYHQVACTFADLHDTPGRLASRGLVHGLVPWSSSRSFFYARLRRRLLELRAVRMITSGSDFGTYVADDDFQHPDLLSARSVDHTSPAVSCVVGQKETSVHCTEADRFIDDHLRNLTQIHALASPDSRSPECPQRSAALQTQECPIVCNGPSLNLDELSKSVPAIGVQYSTAFARGLAYLRCWFIESKMQVEKRSESASPLNDRAVNEISNGSEIPSDALFTSPIDQKHALAEIWDNNHLAVGDWLAEQLGANAYRFVPSTANLSQLPSALHHVVAVPQLSPIHSQLDLLRCREFFGRLRNYVTNSSDMLNRLSSFLNDTLDKAQRDHLVRLLSCTGSVVEEANMRSSPQ